MANGASYREPRIFIGFSDVANIINSLSRGYKQIGIEVSTWTVLRKKFYPTSEYDFVEEDYFPVQSNLSLIMFLAKGIKRILLFFKFISRIRDYDAFLFFYYRGQPSFIRLLFVKLFGKKVFSFFWGSDIRCIEVFEKEMKQLGYFPEVEPFITSYRKIDSDNYRRKKWLVRKAELFSDKVFSQPGYAQLQTKEYFRATVPIYLDDYNFHVPERDVPSVVHAPSDRRLKGTEIIIRIFKELEAEGVPFRWILLENVSNEEVRKQLSTADIVVDQIFSDTIATFALEAMASGNAVIARYKLEYSKVPDGCPVVDATIFNLKEKLLLLIEDKATRIKLARDGLSYVKKHHDCTRVCRDILETENLCS